MVALTFNVGSSSLKFALFDGETSLLRGKIDTNHAQLTLDGATEGWPHASETAPLLD